MSDLSLSINKTAGGEVGKTEHTLGRGVFWVDQHTLKERVVGENGEVGVY